MRVHRNLHNARRGGPQWVETKGGRVQRYLEEVVMLDVTTRIQPAGARKCRETQVRGVCAFFDGSPAGDWQPQVPHSGWQRVSYDPRSDIDFMAGGLPWNAARAVCLDADGHCYVLEPEWRD